MTVLGVAALALLFAWLFGSFLLRFGGLLLLIVGAVVLTLWGNGNGILVGGTSAVFWLFGHGLYALRRGAWKSRLAAAASSGSALSGLVDSAPHRPEVRHDKLPLAGAEAREVQRQA